MRRYIFSLLAASALGVSSAFAECDKIAQAQCKLDVQLENRKCDAFMRLNPDNYKACLMTVAGYYETCIKDAGCHYTQLPQKDDAAPN